MALFPVRTRRVAVDELGESGGAERPAEEPSTHNRREFLKKVAGAALAVPAAGALIESAAAAPRISLQSRARPFEGVTLQFAKAPFGTDEKDVISKLLKPFEDKTGAKVVHT